MLLLNRLGELEILDTIRGCITILGLKLEGDREGMDIIRSCILLPISLFSFRSLSSLRRILGVYGPAVCSGGRNPLLVIGHLRLLLL